MMLSRASVSLAALVVGGMGALTLPGSGALLLGTDFSGRTVSGKTASNITWSENGLTTVSSLTAVDEAPTNAAFTALFDTANAQGYFAPDKNIDNEGPWSTTVTVDVSSPAVSLENIELDWQHFTNSGGFQGPARAVQWTISVTGSLSGLLPGGTASDSANATSGTNTVTFASPLTLTDAESYDIRIFVESPGGSGNNTGFGGLAFNGDVVPEPSTLLLFGFGSLSVLLRRRR